MQKLNKNSAGILALVLVFPVVAVAQARDAGMDLPAMSTRWTASVNPENPLPEYPRPQLVRPHWQNLNGLWDYAVTGQDVGAPAKYEGKILVPYPIESALSRVHRQLLPQQRLWYRRTLIQNGREQDSRTLLHFGAVDYLATVYLNGKEIGNHVGGYQGFTFDITDALKPGANELVVKVYDPTDAGSNPHGKQSLQPKEIFYTAASGIWQTVWLETVPRTYIERLQMTPDIDRGVLRLRVDIAGDRDSYSIEVAARDGAAMVARASVVADGVAELSIPQPRLWSPDAPFLYELEVRLLRSGKVADKVESYFGMRKIEVRKDGAGNDRLFLNNRYIFNLGVLDQGYWPDGIYTAPTDAALKFDVEAIKAMGFNTIRKHVKIEADRWYYHCDKLGLLVWQDMVPPGAQTPAARVQFESEVTENLAKLHNHPSIVMWVLFNEGWGAYDQERLARWLKEMDPSRLLNGHSGSFDSGRIEQWKRGWDPVTLAKVLGGQLSDSGLFLAQLEKHGDFFDPASWVGSDIVDVHVYPGPVLPPAAPGKARVLGEFGGIGVPIDGHTWNGFQGWGYLQKTPDQLLRTHAEMMKRLKVLETQGLAASIYTQPFDVESEQNGLMTYDREIIKIPVQELRQINSLLNPGAQNSGLSKTGFSAQNADMTPEADRYPVLLAQYKAGNREPLFLKRLALMAVRHNDRTTASAAGNEFIARLKKPYARNDWLFISEVTQTSKDQGFKILRALSKKASDTLDGELAERKIREVIRREEIEPFSVQANSTPHWTKIEKRVVAQYGDSMRDTVHEAAMLFCLERQDWRGYGEYFVAYFNALFARGKRTYNIIPLSRVLVDRVSDPQILSEAIKLLGRDIDAFAKGGAASYVSTYARLLYKAGRVSEAIDWQEKALQLCAGKDALLAKELKGQLEEMKLQAARVDARR